MRRKSSETIISKESEVQDLSAEYFADGYPQPEEFLKILQENNPELVENYQIMLKLCETFRAEGGRALLVGGSVRDHYFGLAPKDYDVEVYRVQPERIKEILAGLGPINEVGESFSIIKLTLPNGGDIDVSLPRIDNKTGEGHNDFKTKADPFMSIQEAALRRDFTMNSLAADPLTGEVYNYYDGINDIKNRILRVTDEKKFQEDITRVLRGLQFIGRMNLTVEEKTWEIMESMVPRLGAEADSRKIEEWSKLMLKSVKPSAGLVAAKGLGILKMWQPDLDKLSEIQQEEEWHPEGDVWQHTLMAVDAANEHLADFGLDEEQKFNVMLATLCHDLGKATTTEYSAEKGRIISHGHEEAGAEPTRRILESIGFSPNSKDIIKVIKLVTEHLSPTLLYASRFEGNNRVKAAADGAIRRLAKRIHPATIRELIAVATADHLGRGPFTEGEGQILINLYTAGQWLMEEAERLGVDKKPPKKVLKGRDLLTLGFTPGINVGRVMTLADNLRDSQGLSETDVLGQIVIAKPEGVKNLEDEEEVIATLEKLFQS